MTARQSQKKRTEGFAGNDAAQAVLTNLGFPSFRNVPETDRVSGVLPDSWAGGIYVFECDNGEGYVGQTRGALSSRLSSHPRAVPGIRAVTFLRTKRSLLDERERQAYDELQRAGVRLKNVTFARLEPGPSARFAEIMPEEDQAAWLADPTLIIDGDHRPAEDERTTRAEQDFELFCAHPAAGWMVRAMGR